METGKRIIGMAVLASAALAGVAVWAATRERPDVAAAQARADAAHLLEAPTRHQRDVDAKQARLQARADRGESLDVGDPDSFGRPVKWLGMMSTVPVTLRADCSDAPSDPSISRCMPLVNGAGYAEFNDLDSITLPGRSIGSFICHAQTPLIVTSLRNTTGTPNQRAMVAVFPHLDIDSPVFADPALTDPETGEPLNGTLRIYLSTAQVETYLAPGQFANLSNRATRSCIGGLLTRATMQTFYGLSPRQVESFYAQPIRLRVGATINAAGVNSASAHLGYRFTTD